MYRLIFLAVLGFCTVARGATLTVEAGASIQSVVDRAKPGDTVLVRAGTYRQSVHIRHSGRPDAPIRLVAEQPGAVVISGADVVNDFQRLDGDEPIYRIFWPHVFAIDHQNDKPIEFHPESAPIFGRAEQVMADDQLLLPCKDLADLRSAWKDRKARLQPPVKNLGGPFVGMFAVDTTYHALYLWLADAADPNAHAMQAAARPQVLGVSEFESEQGVHDVQVSGFIFRYAANFPQRAAVVLHGSHNTLDHCLIERMSGTGVSVAGTMRNCLIRDNGFCGGAVEGDDFVVNHCAWENNCWKPIDRGWESGGAKVCDSRRGQISECIFRRNGGPGLWFDIDCRDISVSDCAFVQNELSGLFIEISRGFKVQNNLVFQNAVGIVGQVRDDDWSCGGIQIAESAQCTVQSNTCIDNKDGITLREIGPREVKTRGEKSVYHNTSNTIQNNTIANSHGYAIALWWDNAFFGRHPSQKGPSRSPAYDPAAQNLTIESNVFSDDSKFLFGVPWRPSSKKLATLKDFGDVVGFEKSGNLLTKGVVAPSDIEDRIKDCRPFPMGP